MQGPLSRLLVAVVAIACALLAGGASAEAAPSRGDLQVRKVTGVPKSVLPGKGFSVRVTVANRGRRRAARSTTRVYLSRHARHRRKDVAAGVRAVRALGPRSSTRITIAVRVPRTMAVGRFHVVVCADARRRVRERSERNNCGTAARTVAVVVPPPPKDPSDGSDMSVPPGTGTGTTPPADTTTTDVPVTTTTTPTTTPTSTATTPTTTTPTTTTTTPQAVCGDSIKQDGEVCDDGNTVDETSCPYGQASCTTCNSTCTGMLSLTGGYCGDGIKQADEVCDDGNTADETTCPYGDASCTTCNSTCTGMLSLTGGYCGDGIKQDGEMCDDGNKVDETTCPSGQSTCMACNSTCSEILSLTGP